MKQKDLLEDAFHTLSESPVLTKEQKDKMLNLILLECHSKETSKLHRFGQWITDYPWRFAFLASTVQAMIGTLIFGTGYTNLFLQYIGG